MNKRVGAVLTAQYCRYLIEVECEDAESAKLIWRSGINPSERYIQLLSWNEGVAQAVISLKSSPSPRQFRDGLRDGEIPFNADHRDIANLLRKLLGRQEISYSVKRLPDEGSVGPRRTV